MNKITNIILKIRGETNEKGNDLIDELINELTRNLDSISNTLENADDCQAYLEGKRRGRN